MTGRCHVCGVVRNVLVEFCDHANPGAVVPVAGVGYMVASRSQPGYWAMVNHDGCSCPATTEHCWHVRQVASFVSMQNELHKRPVARTNISAMVD